MEDSSEIQTVPLTASNLRQILTAYFHTRAHLATAESDFHCDPVCTRPGCRNNAILVPVSLVDLMGAALHHNESVSAHYRRHYTLGLIPTEQDDWIRIVSPRLTKPCPFLQNDLCQIYPVRPLACILFPEYLVGEGRFEKEAGKEPFRDFLCLHSPFRLSPERTAIMRRLKTMWEREALISSYYLFKASPCYIDFSNLTKELAQAAGTLRAAEAQKSPEPPAAIPNRVMENFLQEHLAGCPTFAGVSDKISSLNNPEGQMQFLQLLQDDRLIKKLMQPRDDRNLVFSFVKGKFKSKLRSLLPKEYNFY